MHVSVILPSVCGGTGTLINGQTIWSGDVSLYEVINGCRAVWQRLMSDYI